MAYKIMIDEDYECEDGATETISVEYGEELYPSRIAAWRRILDLREEPLNVGYHFWVKEVEDGNNQNEKES